MGETDRNPNRSRGPWFHRLLVWVFGVILSVLVFWLLGFVVDDIGAWPGPVYDEFAEARLDPALVETETALNEQLAETRRAIDDRKVDQQNLRDGMNISRETMNEMRATYRLAIEQKVRTTPAQQDALAESERLFLESQHRYQQAVEQIAQLNGTLRDLEAQQRANNDALAEAREPIDDEYSTLYERHRLKVAAVKLAVLLPLLAIGVWLFIGHRGALYGPLVYAFGVAVAARSGIVMHEYFPTRYFRYILIGIAVIIVARILIHLLRTVAFPKREWLVKQYREAYEAFLCPVCSYPIRRGPLKYRSWTRRSIRKSPARSAAEPESDEPYTCPVCTTTLYEKCESCGATRPSLLPACDRCGATKEPAR